MDSTPSITLKPKSIHFLACVHGMWGAPEHLKTVEDTIRQKFADTESDTELVTLRIRTNAESNTYDGLDWGAERAVKEIYTMIEELESDGLKKVTKFSIFGYSLGGLISRYTIGILYQRGFFHNVKPVNFTTFATPHLGLPRFRGFIGATMHKLGPIMLSRTGRQFYGTDDDKWSPDAKEGRPLLEVMADKDSIFFKALMSFPNVAFYGNAVHDLTVTYCTALAEAHDPFTVLKSKSHRLAIKLDPQYKHVIQSFSEVPTGEPVPLTDIEREHKEQRAAIPWYSPTRYQSSRQGLPPFLQFPFPFNLVLYCLLPALIPAGLLYATVRFRRESHESQLRLKALADSPDAESSLGAIMRRMEMAVADIVDPADPGVASESDMEEGALVTEGKRDDETRKRKAGSPHTPDAEDTAGSLPTPLPTPSSAPSADPMQTSFRPSSKRKPRKSVPKSDREDPDQPVLTPAQLAMIDSLNSIPQLKKVLAYFPYVRNAHSVIIVRDPETFPMHRDGMGVVNHWADRFVL